jgi:hypothetical protein
VATSTAAAYEADESGWYAARAPGRTWSVDLVEVVASGAVELGPVPVSKRRGNRLPDAVALAVLLAVFLAVNNVPTWIRAPYWLDEDWVALSTRVPLKDVPKITSSTPIGWTLLLRLIPDPDALRLLPLAFSLIALLAAYLLGRLLPWRNPATSVLAGFACAAAVVLLPAEQLRQDLKQYTADAAVTLVFLAAAAWLDRSWTRRRLVVVVCAAPVALLLSQITLIVAPSTFAGLVVAAAVRRDRRRLLETVAGCVASLAVMGLLYEVLVAPNRTPVLSAFWSANYPSAPGLPAFVYRRLHALGPSLGYPRHLVILIGLLLTGVVVLAVLRRTATLVAVVVIPALTAALGVARLYPLLDERTCYFLFVAGAALTGIAVAGGAVGLARAIARRREVWWRTPLAGVLVVAALSAFATVNHSWYRFDGLDPRVPNYSPIAVSDVRTQTRWVDAHRAPGDVVLISDQARYGYAFYHDTSTMRWTAAPNTVGWVPVDPADPDVIVVHGSTAAPIANAVGRAVARARSNGARVLIVRSWWGAEAQAWSAALRPYAVTYPYTGTEPVAVIANP